MTTEEIAARVVALNREHNHAQVYAEFYTESTVSVENWGGTPMEYVGLEAIEKKAAEWETDVVEIHSVSVSEPLVSDQSFAIVFAMDVTYKSRGREAMKEMALYTVQDGKIAREEFQA
jgi:hypothetical protein